MSGGDRGVYSTLRRGYSSDESKRILQESRKEDKEIIFLIDHDIDEGTFVKIAIRTNSRQAQVSFKIPMKE